MSETSKSDKELAEELLGAPVTEVEMPYPSVPALDQVRRGGGSAPLRHCNSISPYGTICDCRPGHAPPHESFGGLTWTEAEAIKPKRVIWKRRLKKVSWVLLGILIWQLAMFLFEWSKSWWMAP